MITKPTLYFIEGEELVSVCFILDYIQFDFGEFGIASLSRPILFEAGTTYVFDKPGYRDALCRQISKRVKKTLEAERALGITFGDGSRIIIPLDASWPPGPEMATMSGKGTFYAAWIRPN